MENYLIENYQDRIYKLLDSDKYPLYLREHYSESPNWYVNDWYIKRNHAHQSTIVEDTSY